MASDDVFKDIVDAAMSPVCQEFTGCTKGCVERAEKGNLDKKSCKDFDECLSGCRSKAAKLKKPLEFSKKTNKKKIEMVADGPKTYAEMKREFNAMLGRHPKAVVEQKAEVRPGKRTELQAATEFLKEYAAQNGKESEYVRLKSEFNRILGVHVRPSVRHTAKISANIKPGSATDLLRKHREALGKRARIRA